MKNEIQIPEGYDKVRLLVGFDREGSLRGVEAECYGGEWTESGYEDVSWAEPPQRIALLMKKPSVTKNSNPVQVFVVEDGVIKPFEQDAVTTPRKGRKDRLPAGTASVTS